MAKLNVHSMSVEDLKDCLLQLWLAQKEIDQLREVGRDAVTQIADLTAKLAKRDEDLKLNEQTLIEAQGIVTALEDDYAEAQKNLAAADSGLARRDKRIEELEAEKRAQMQRITELNISVDKLKDEVAFLKRENNAIAIQRDKYKRDADICAANH